MPSVLEKNSDQRWLLWLQFFERMFLPFNGCATRSSTTTCKNLKWNCSWLMRKSSILARLPTHFGFTDEIDCTEEFDDVDSQQEQTGFTQPMQSTTEKFLDIEHHNIHNGFTQNMVIPSLSDAPDISLCRKFSNYAPFICWLYMAWNQSCRNMWSHRWNG